MTKICYDFEDIIVYIDNIIHFTKSSFDHHLQRLYSVLQRLQEHNLHVHIEETFLATKEVDYLGYTLSPKGIKPQNKKILAILALAEPYGHLPKTDLNCNPWEIIQIDLFGPWMFQDVTQATHQIQGLSIIDVATRWIELCPYS